MPSGASCCGAKRLSRRQFRQALRDWFAPPIDAPVPCSANLTCLWPRARWKGSHREDATDGTIVGRFVGSRSDCGQRTR